MLDTLMFRLATSNEGELAHEWNDKPHRLVYDLSNEVERLQKILLDMGRPDLLVAKEYDRPIEWDKIRSRIVSNRTRFNESLVSPEECYAKRTI
jgi:hypothetical protein